MSQFLKQNKELKTDALALPTVQVQVRHRLYSVKEGRRRKRYSRSPNTVEVRGSVKTEDAPSAISNQQSAIINHQHNNTVLVVVAFLFAALFSGRQNSRSPRRTITACITYFLFHIICWTVMILNSVGNDRWCRNCIVLTPP